MYGPVITLWQSAPLAQAMWQPYQQPSKIPCVKRFSQTVEAILSMSGCLPYWKLCTGSRS